MLVGLAGRGLELEDVDMPSQLMSTRVATMPSPLLVHLEYHDVVQLQVVHDVGLPGLQVDARLAHAPHDVELQLVEGRVGPPRLVGFHVRAVEDRDVRV
eukprot:11800675-Heterocapsa_arctica.AAC.1